MANKSLMKCSLAVLFAGLVLLAPKVARADDIQIGYCTFGASCVPASYVTVTGATPIANLSSGTNTFTWSGGGFTVTGTVTTSAGGSLGGSLAGDSLSVSATATDSNGTAGVVDLLVGQYLPVVAINPNLPNYDGYPLPNSPNNTLTFGPGSSFLSGSCNAAAMADGSSVAGSFLVEGNAGFTTGTLWSSLPGSCASGSFSAAGSGYTVFNVPPAACHGHLVVIPPECLPYLEDPAILAQNGNALFDAEVQFNFAGNTTGTAETIDIPIGGSLPTGTQTTPEPSTLLLMGCALAGLAGLRRRA